MNALLLSPLNLSLIHISSRDDDNIECFRQLMLANRQITVDETEDELVILYGNEHYIIFEHWQCKQFVYIVWHKGTLKTLSGQEWKHSPFSPNLASCDFHMFGPMKEVLGDIILIVLNAAQEWF